MCEILRVTEYLYHQLVKYSSGVDDGPSFALWMSREEETWQRWNNNVEPANISFPAADLLYCTYHSRFRPFRWVCKLVDNFGKLINRACNTYSLGHLVCEIAERITHQASHARAKEV